MADIPERKIDSELDDIQGVNLDIDNLFNKFILPIDRMRSFSAVTSIERPVIADGESIANDAANTADTDPSQLQESRTHAFYRMIGFPVINENEAFYNPGFDPVIKADERTKIYNISSKIPKVVSLSSTLRESYARTSISVFSRRSIDSCIHAIAMGSPIGIKPFLQMNTEEGFNSLAELDEQKFNLPDRKKYIDSRYKRTDGKIITNYFDSGSHILRPFTVDPNIIDAISGFSNETRHVCAPFLPTKANTAIERGLYTKRPGIEFILRARLNSQPGTALSQVILSNSSITNESDLSNFEVAEVVSALLNVNGQDISNQDIIDRFKNSSNTELLNINKLVKIIKGVVQLFIDSIENIASVQKKIQWVPLPSVTGPENGSDSTSLITSKQKTEIENRILNLKIRAAEGKRQVALSDSGSVVSSDFHLSGYENVEKVWDNQLLEEREQRDNYQRIGSNALSCIEIISGEISGLGLIDVLAIYTALWAIDIDVLISMLDERSFDRLYTYNPDLRNTSVQNRRTNGPKVGIVKAMNTFERQVINILSYSDRIFQQKLGSPVNAEGGNVPKVQL